MMEVWGRNLAVTGTLACPWPSEAAAWAVRRLAERIPFGIERSGCCTKVAEKATGHRNDAQLPPPPPLPL